MATSEEVQAVRKDIQDPKSEMMEFMRKTTEFQDDTIAKMTTINAGAEDDRELAANIRSNLAPAATEWENQLQEVIGTVATIAGTTAELIGNHKTMDKKLDIVEKSIENNANNVIVMDKDIAKAEKDINHMSDTIGTAIMGRVNIESRSFKRPSTASRRSWRKLHRERRQQDSHPEVLAAGRGSTKASTKGRKEPNRYSESCWKSFGQTSRI